MHRAERLVHVPRAIVAGALLRPPLFYWGPVGDCGAAAAVGVRRRRRRLLLLLLLQLLLLQLLLLLRCCCHRARRLCVAQA